MACCALNATLELGPCQTAKTNYCPPSHTWRNTIRILTLDIELAPNLATVWALWKVNISTDALIETSRVLCFAAKWYGSDEVLFSSEWKDGQKAMLKQAHKLLDEADVVVGYNQAHFDIPLLNREFLKLGLRPPAPFKNVDLLSVVRKKFRFVSNKLAHVVKELGVGEKMDSGGHETWLAVMQGEKSACLDMEKYNRHDVVITEALYERLKPWIKGHPNHNLHSEGKSVCPNCGGHHLIKRGYFKSSTHSYQKYQCKDCGAWSRDRLNDGTKPCTVVGT